MFERFTPDAREVVILAQEEARALRHDAIGSEHLLLSLLRLDTPTTAVLRRHGLDHDALAEAVAARAGGEDLDGEALRTLGIDLDTVRDVAEATFGPGALDAPHHRRWRGSPAHIPFTAGAKKVLELSLREALAIRSRSISDGHIALGLLRAGGTALTLLRERGVDPEALRADLGRSAAA